MKINVRRKFFPLIFCFILCVNTATSLRGEDPQDSRKTLTPLHKSLLYPGWGQLSENRILDGVLFMAAETLCLYQVVSNNRSGNLSYADYKAAESKTTATENRALTERYDTRRNQWILAAAGVWVANLVNIHFIVKNKGKQNNQIQFRMDRVSSKTIAFHLSYRF